MAQRVIGAVEREQLDPDFMLRPKIVFVRDRAPEAIERGFMVATLPRGQTFGQSVVAIFIALAQRSSNRK
jgi:hypothetical protein